MPHIKPITISLFFLMNSLSAFQDSDMDGVEDQYDLCKETPFDILVNSDGCPKKSEEKRKNTPDYWGEISLKVALDTRRDKAYEDSSSTTLYANYRYDNWGVSLSNIQETTNNNYNTNSDNNDIYLSTSYSYLSPQSQLKVLVGSRFVDKSSTGSKKSRNRQRRDGGEQEASLGGSKKPNSTPNNDYFGSLNFDYFLNDNQDIFTYYSYTLNGNKKENNYSSLGIGSGYYLNDNWYTALSYNYMQASYSSGTAMQSISWYNSYNISPNIFTTASYQYGLTEASYEHTLSLGIGVLFK